MIKRRRLLKVIAIMLASLVLITGTAFFLLSRLKKDTTVFASTADRCRSEE